MTAETPDKPAIKDAKPAAPPAALLDESFSSPQRINLNSHLSGHNNSDLTLDTDRLFKPSTAGIKMTAGDAGAMKNGCYTDFLCTELKPAIDLATAFYGSVKAKLSQYKPLTAAQMDIQPGSISFKPGESLQSIAEKWTSGQSGVKAGAYLNELRRVNHLHPGEVPKNGAQLLMPGHTPDGAFVVKDKDGSMTISYADGRERVVRADQRGHDRVPGKDGGYSEKHWGPNPEDNFDLIKTDKGDFELAGKPGDKPKALMDDPKLVEQRKHLNELAATTIKDSEQLAKFHADMARLEARAIETHLPADEVNKTYQAVERLLDEKQHTRWSMPMDQRVVLAEQVMSQAAVPTSINQGTHQTCNVTTVEVRTYSLHPSNAANLVADVALSGTYQSPMPKPHGTLIHLNSKSLKPDTESSVNPPKDGDRSLATQLFNVTAINLVHQAEHSGQVYVNDPNGGDEVLYDKRKHKTVKNDPDLRDDQIVRAYDLINQTNRKMEPIVLIDTDDNVCNDKNCAGINSEAGLLQKIREAKKNGLPAILGVDSNVEPFWTDSGHGAAGGSSGDHVVTVTGINEGPPLTVNVDNQWGSKADHLEKNNAIPLRQLFIAMHPPKDAEPLLAADVDADRKAGKFNAWQELELARLHHFNQTGDLKDASAPIQLTEDYEYTEKLQHLITQATTQWADQAKNNTLDSAEKERVKKKIGDLLDDPNIPTSGQLRILTLCRDQKLIEQNDYDKDFAQIMTLAGLLKDSKPGHTAKQKIDYEYNKQELREITPQLKNAVANMTPEQKKSILATCLDDDDNPDAVKLVMLRTVHDLAMVPEDEFIKLAGKAMQDLKKHQAEGKYEPKSEHEIRHSAIEQRHRLLTELPKALAEKIKEEEKAEK